MTKTLPTEAARPTADEYNAYYATYINRVPAGPITDLLAEQLERTGALLAPLTPEQVAYRPKPDDWNIAEVLGHITDGERVFCYRALTFARNDTTMLPSFDQDLYVANADFAQRPFDTLIEEYTAVRRATLAFFGNLAAEAWVRQGVANNSPVSVRALAYIIAGHELHHVADFRERYFAVWADRAAAPPALVETTGQGKSTVVPMLDYEDGPAAMDWLIKAFGFQEVVRMVTPDGRLDHGELSTGSGRVMLASVPGYENPKHHRAHCDRVQAWSAMPWVVDGVLVYIDNVDQHYAQAVQSGAIILTEPEDGWPGRRYRAEDLEGHRWMFMQSAGRER